MILQKLKFYRVVALTLFISLLLVGGADQVGATTATFAQDTTVSMDVGNMTIKADSKVNSITTTATTITLSMSAGQSFTLESSGRKKLDNDRNISVSCQSGKSVLEVSGSSFTSIVITPNASECESGGGGGGGGGGAVAVAPTPTPTPTVSPGVSPTPQPAAGPPLAETPASRGFVNLESVSLNDGDVVSATGSDDPDVYIVNPHGYKRLFLNPAIFGFYGHLGGFSAVKTTTSATRDVFVTSGLFRNCETDDPKVYGAEVTGEDAGVLHWVNTTGEQAVADDSEFFKKVFCINTNEFNWYPKGDDYTSVNQIPDYARGSVSSSVQAPVSTVYKVISSVGYLNVRASATTASSVLGQLSAGNLVTSLAQDGVWHKIMFEGQEAWVHGDYLEAI